MSHFDILVIGSGPAGYYAALTCGRNGWKTAIVESREWGGTGFSSGCLPVKKLLHEVRVREAASIEINGEEILGKYRKFSDKTADREKVELEKAGVELIEGAGRFTSGKTYLIEGREIHGDKIIIATGSEPSAPDGISLDGPIISHREAVRLKKMPQSMIIVGGDVEGMEFAALFSRFGTKVTVVEQADQILPGYDRDLVAPVVRSLGQSEILCSEKVFSIDKGDDYATVHTDKGEYRSELVLVTGMRSPSIPGGLLDLDVAIGDGYIKANDNFETSVPGIFAIGDINGKLGMGSSAVQQAVQLCDYIHKGWAVGSDYSLLPRAVFTLPQICGAGLQERDIPSGQKNRYTIRTADIGQSWRSFEIDRPGQIVKVISDENEVIRGIWFSCDNAEYHGQAASYIIRANMTIRDLRRDLYIHPTEFETLFEAVLR